MKVIPLKLRLSNAYIIQGERSILVDTGSPNEASTILKALNKHGIAPADLSLILHTHVHSDHVGSTVDLLQDVDVPVAFHQSDMGLAEQGANGALTGVGLRGKIMARFFSNGTFTAPNADFFVEDGMSLAECGVGGKVVHTPGHTSGSISILLENGEAIVGDLLMGGYLGGAVLPSKPNRHYFTEDLAANRASLEKILATSARTLYVGHGGPLDAKGVKAIFQK